MKWNFALNRHRQLKLSEIHESKVVRKIEQIQLSEVNYISAVMFLCNRSNWTWGPWPRNEMQLISMTINRMNGIFNMLLWKPIALAHHNQFLFAFNFNYSTSWEKHVHRRPAYRETLHRRPKMCDFVFGEIFFSDSTTAIQFYSNREPNRFKMIFWKLLLWPLDKTRQFRWRFERATPFRKFEMMRNFAATVLRLSGIRVLSDCAWEWHGIISFVYACQCFVFALYTTYYYWDINKITAIQPYALMPFLIPVGELF